MIVGRAPSARSCGVAEPGVETSAGNVFESVPAQLYPKDVELFHQGSVLQEVLYVECGSAKLVRHNDRGQDSIVELAVSGACLGTAAVLADAAVPVSAVTCTPTSLRRLSAAAFRRLLATDSTFGRRIHELHARELCRQTGWMGQMHALTGRERLQCLMLQFITAFQLNGRAHDMRLRFPLRHWEVARVISVTPEHLSRLLRALEDEGILQRHKGWVVVGDVNRLYPACWSDRGPRFHEPGVIVSSF